MIFAAFFCSRMMTDACYRLIEPLLEQAGAGLEHLVRLDCYVCDRAGIHEEQQRCRAALGDAPVTSTMFPVPLGLRGEVEITSLAVVPG